MDQLYQHWLLIQIDTDWYRLTQIDTDWCRLMIISEGWYKYGYQSSIQFYTDWSNLLALCQTRVLAFCQIWVINILYSSRVFWWYTNYPCLIKFTCILPNMVNQCTTKKPWNCIKCWLPMFGKMQVPMFCIMQVNWINLYEIVSKIYTHICINLRL